MTVTLTEFSPPKHTPGPWAIKYRLGDRDTMFIESEDRTIGKIYGRNFVDCEADAQLIHCAPDMLQSLKELYAFLCDEEARGAGLDEIRMVGLKALIEKAGG